MILVFYFLLYSLHFFCKLVCQDSDEFLLPLPTELVISRGYAASFKRLDPQLATAMLVLLRAGRAAWQWFHLSFIDHNNREVISYNASRNTLRAAVWYYTDPVNGTTPSYSDEPCANIPRTDTILNFYFRFVMASAPLEFSCGGFRRELIDSNAASSHLWRNLVKVRLSGEGNYTQLSYVPVEIPSVSTYSSQWEVPLPGNKYFIRGDKLEIAFKIYRVQPYFFTLSAPGPDDHWLCFVRTAEDVRIYQTSCWDPKTNKYREDTSNFVVTRNLPPWYSNNTFLVQIVHTGTHYKYAGSAIYLATSTNQSDLFQPPIGDAMDKIS